jgi:hypothetical protein
MVDGGDQAIGVATNSVLFLIRTSSLGKTRGRGIYTPPRIVAVAAASAGYSGPARTRNLRPNNPPLYCVTRTLTPLSP